MRISSVTSNPPALSALQGHAQSRAAEEEVALKDLLGQVLNGHYRVDAFIGRGGMAEVYRAFDLRRSYPVAVKIMRADLAEDVEFMNRFRREASSLARLAHDNIVRFYEFAREGRMAFLVMDYVEGITLRLRILEAEGPMPLEEVRDILHQVCVALHYAHEEGIVHCDVKPGNIMLRSDGRVQVADFGIAKAMGSMTLTAVMPGTPAYMSPEQCRNQPLDRRTDVYALGIVAYEMLVGRRPFRGDSEGSRGGTARERTRWEQLHAPPPPLRPLNPEIPPHMEEAILHALAKNPDDRPQTVLAFHHELIRDEERAPSVAVRPAGDVESPVPPPRAKPVVPSRKTEAARLYDRAVESMAQEEWDLAIQHLNAILAVEPGYRDTIARLTEANRRKRIAHLLTQAQAALDNEDWPAAIALSTEVIATDPPHTAARELLHKARIGRQCERRYAQAVEALEVRDWETARVALREVLVLEPTYRDADALLEQATLGREQQERLIHLRLEGEQAFRNGRWETAIRCFQELLSLEPAQSQVHKLVEQAREELETDQRASALFEQASAHAEQEEWVSATETAEKALALRPGTPTYRRLLEQAQSTLDLEVQYAFACAALDKQQWQKALDLLQQILERAPDYRHANYLLEQAREGEVKAEQLSVPDETAPMADERAARVKETWIAGLVAQARAFGEVGNWERAAQLYGEACALAPERPELEGLLAAAQEELGKKQPAAPDQQQMTEERAARIRETWIADLAAQARAFEEVGNWEQAVRLYGQALDLAPDRKELAESLAAAQKELERQQT